MQKSDSSFARLVANLASPLPEVRLRAASTIASKVELGLVSEESLLRDHHNLVGNVLKSINEYNTNGDVAGLAEMTKLICLLAAMPQGKKVIEAYGAIEFFVEFSKHCQRQGFSQPEQLALSFVKLAIHGGSWKHEPIHAKDYAVAPRKLPGRSELVASSSTSTCFFFQTVEASDHDKARLLRLTAGLRLAETLHPGMPLLDDVFSLFENADAGFFFSSAAEAVIHTIKLVERCQDSLLSLRLWGALCSVFQLSVREAEIRDCEETGGKLTVELLLGDCFRLLSTFCLERTSLVYVSHLTSAVAELTTKRNDAMGNHLLRLFGEFQRENAQKEQKLSLDQQRTAALCELSIFPLLPNSPSNIGQVDIPRVVAFARKGWVPPHRFADICKFIEKSKPELLAAFAEAQFASSALAKLRSSPTETDIQSVCTRCSASFAVLDKKQIFGLLSSSSEAIRRSFSRYVCLALAFPRDNHCQPLVVKLLNEMVESLPEQLTNLLNETPLGDTIVLSLLEDDSYQLKNGAASLIRFSHPKLTRSLAAVYSVATADKGLQALCDTELVNLSSFFSADCRTRMHAFNKLVSSYRSYDVLEGLLDDQCRPVFYSELEVYRCAARPTPFTEEEIKLLLNLLTNGGNPRLDESIRAEALEQVALAVAQGCERLSVVAASFLSDRMVDEEHNSVLLPMLLCVMAFLRLPGQSQQQKLILNQVKDRLFDDNFAPAQRLIERARGESARFRFHLMAFLQYLVFDLSPITARIESLFETRSEGGGKLLELKGFVPPLFFQASKSPLGETVPADQLVFPEEFELDKFLQAEAEACLKISKDGDLVLQVERISAAFATFNYFNTLKPPPKVLLSTMRTLIVRATKEIDRASTKERTMALEALALYLTLGRWCFSDQNDNCSASDEKTLLHSPKDRNLVSGSPGGSSSFSLAQGKSIPASSKSDKDDLGVLPDRFLADLANCLLLVRESDGYLEQKVAIELARMIIRECPTKADELISRCQPLNAFCTASTSTNEPLPVLLEKARQAVEFPASVFSQKALTRALVALRKSAKLPPPETILKVLVFVCCSLRRVQTAALQLLAAGLNSYTGEARLLIAQRCRPLVESVCQKASGYVQVAALRALTLLPAETPLISQLRVSTNSPIALGLYARLLVASSAGDSAVDEGFWTSALGQAPNRTQKAFLLGEVAELMRAYQVSSDGLFDEIDFGSKLRTPVEVSAAMSVLRLICSEKAAPGIKLWKGMQIASLLLPLSASLLPVTTWLANKCENLASLTSQSPHVFASLVKQAFRYSSVGLLSALVRASHCSVKQTLQPSLASLLADEFGKCRKSKSKEGLDGIFSLFRAIFAPKPPPTPDLSQENVDCLSQLADTLHKWFVVGTASDSTMELKVLKVLQLWICNPAFEPYFDFKHGIFAQILSLSRTRCDSPSSAPLILFLAKAATVSRARTEMFKSKFIEQLVARVGEKAQIIDRKGELSERFDPAFQFFAAVSFDPLSLRRICPSSEIFDLYETLFASQPHAQIHWLILFANFALSKSLKPCFFESKKVLRRVELLLVESEDVSEVCLCSQFFYNILFKDTGLLAEVDGAELERKMRTVLREKERQWDRLNAANKKDGHSAFVKLILNNLISIRNILLAV